MLASSLAAIPFPDPENIESAIIGVMGRKRVWINRIAKKYCEEFKGTTRPTHRQIFRWLTKHLQFPNQDQKTILIQGKVTSQTTYGARSERLRSLHLPAIDSVGDLSRFLGLDSMEELDWLVAPNRFRRLRLHHYQSRLVKKRSGQFRLVEGPRSRLKFVQRILLHEILDHVPVSDACFGFVKGRHVKQFAGLHCGQGMVLRMDLEDFFPSIATGRVHALWRSLGYVDQVATYLTWLCTVPPRELTDEQLHSTPVAARSNLEAQCRRDRLPQGAPTSGALANLIAFRMDQRFVGLAKKTGGRYSRYADDLAFSWPRLSERQSKNLSSWIAATILESGFQVNFRKTRVMRCDQRQSLAGIVVNDRPSIARDTIETLRATLFNCVRFGPESQNREMHPDFQGLLRGRIAWVDHVHPSAGQRLSKIYDRICW